ncbi:MAG TPA: hypothetical protein VG692_18920 [Gemmatimonadales bacterium]|nr:hypothetical protein [Gemmatimonadales bacterium]
MVRRYLLPALLALAACSGSDNTGPDRISMTGSWRQSADLREPTTGDRHINLGAFSLAQSGDQFSGDGSQGIDAYCTTANAVKYTGPLADPAPFPVEGTLTGREVVFTRTDAAVSCTYRGSFVDGSTTRMTGTATCGYTQNNVHYAFAGQWQADKQ